MATTKKKATTTKVTGKKTEMKMIMGADIGNGWSKIKYTTSSNNGKLGEPKVMDFPSVIAYVPVGYKWTPATPTDEYMDELVNKLDCDVKTPVIPEMDKRRMLVGERATVLSTSLQQFSIDDVTPKSDTSLAYQLLLSSIAAGAIDTYWEQHGELPETSLHVDVDLGVALPFTDYIANKDQYKNKLEDNRHTVNVHNFDIEITVHVSFSSVNVLAEGQAAVYAVGSMPESFWDQALSLSKDSGLELDDEIDGETLLNYDSVIALDLGSKTTDTALFIEGELEASGSNSLLKGYANVIENMLDAIRNTPYALSSRNELENVLLNENPTPAQRAVKEKLVELEGFEADSLARDITAEYKRVLAPVKMNIEAVYVFGGGADRMKEYLYPMLREASEVAPSVYLPVVWMDSTWSRVLNRNGLYMLAEMAYETR